MIYKIIPVDCVERKSVEQKQCFGDEFNVGRPSLAGFSFSTGNQIIHKAGADSASSSFIKVTSAPR
jgi:hypothetical protein